MLNEILSIVYVALGPKYVEECIESIKSVREHNSVLVNVYTDEEGAKRLDNVADATHIAAGPQGYFGKVTALVNHPESRFLFLDTDVFCTKPLKRLIGMLDVYGVLAAREPLIDTFRRVDLKRPTGWPNFEFYSDVELNTGVVGINRDHLPDEFFQRWIQFHAELVAANGTLQAESIQDQPSFHRAIAECRVAVGILSQEYNFRACYPTVLLEPPVLIHTRAPSWKQAHRWTKNIEDITAVFPCGLRIGRRGFANRSLFALRRALSSGGWQ